MSRFASKMFAIRLVLPLALHHGCRIAGPEYPLVGDDALSLLKGDGWGQGELILGQDVFAGPEQGQQDAALVAV